MNATRLPAVASLSELRRGQRGEIGIVDGIDVTFKRRLMPFGDLERAGGARPAPARYRRVAVQGLLDGGSGFLRHQSRSLLHSHVTF